VAGLGAEPRYRDVRLVIVGDYSRDVFYSAYESLRHEVEALPPGTVVFAGYRDDETIARLLASAAALVLPSLEEGFGLPGIEAAACGTAVVATRFSALPEALGDAALYIDPFDAASVDSALRLVLDDECLRKKLGVAGMERAKSFTWPAAARRITDVFDQLEPARGR
jgi:alpha-1,3-rhamnosyl/mannosyltransferase